MDRYDESCIIEAERDVEEIRNAALAKVQRLYPEIEHVVDRRTIDDYCCKRWDYPGQWYYAGFQLPAGFRSKDELIDAIARDTIQYFNRKY